MTSKKTEKTKPESSWQKPETILAIAGLLIAVCALYFSSESNQTTLDALNLQKQQSIESDKKDSIREIRDSMKYVNSLKVSQEQIEALKQQVQILQRSTAIEEKSKMPYLDAIQFGFHKIDEKGNRVLMFKVVNNGVRAAMLTAINFAIFYSNFEKNEVLNYEIKKMLVNDEAVIYTYAPKKNNKNTTWTEDQVKQIDSFYAVTSFKYYDFISYKLITTNPVFFKWTPTKGLIREIHVGDVSIFPLDPVGSEKEINALKIAFNKALFASKPKSR